MLRFVGISLVIAAAAVGCGRSTPYTYAPGQGPRLTPPDLPLPDGGVIKIMPPPTLDGGPQCRPVESDLYTLPPTDKRPIDVLFVVDDSASMKNDQDALAANFKSFISSFTTNSVDFQLGVVTTDMTKPTKQGRLETVDGVKILKPSMLDIEDKFSRLVKVGTEGSPDEKCLAAAKAALSSPLIDAAEGIRPEGANFGFLRPEADLGIVFVGDEDDHDKATVASYVDFFKGLKPDIAAVSVSAIALQNGILCSTASWRMVQTARGFGPRGLVSSCTPDYASTLKAIGGRLLDSHCVIGLKRWLEDGAKVHVLVNGQNSSFIPFPPDEAYPNGSLQVLTCPTSGGSVELVYEECLEP